MKAVFAAILMLASTSLMADRPDCSLTPGGCAGDPPGNGTGGAVSVPEPSAIALIGLGLAGLVVARRRR